MVETVGMENTTDKKESERFRINTTPGKQKAKEPHKGGPAEEAEKRRQASWPGHSKRY